MIRDRREIAVSRLFNKIAPESFLSFMMHRCQFCDAEIAAVDGAVVPGTAMIAALDKGYVPTMCPHWSVMQQKPVSQPDSVTDEDVLRRWNNAIRVSETSWRLCNTCFSTLAPYLPPRPVYPSEQIAQDAWKELNYVLPLNCSGWAIAASYAGLFAVLVFPAPIALILGIIALRHINKNKERKLGGKARALFAVVMGTIFTTPLLFMFFLLILGILGY